MIKKLRVRFIVLTMSLLFALLAILLGVINTINYTAVVAEADELLEILSENKGSFPQPNDKNFPPRPFSPETPYETRYFTVQLDSQGNAVFVNTGKIASVDSDTAAEYAKKVWAEQGQRGFEGDYRYTVKTDAKGTLVLFLDCGRKLAGFRTFFAISGLITLAGYLLVSVLLAVFSKRIVKPFSDNYEKQKLFITNASHELKTPLTIISADADVLEGEIGENEWLSDIKKQAARMADMTGEFINLSRAEEASEAASVLFPLSDIVLETAQSFRATAMAQSKDLSIDIQPMMSLFGNQEAISRLVSILLDNAIKYCTDKGEIRFSLKAQGKTVLISAQNTSEVLTEKQCTHLFERFYRTDASRSSETGGHGIGLSVAKAIVQSHSGKIEAKMKGDVFCIEAQLPLKTK